MLAMEKRRFRRFEVNVPCFVKTPQAPRAATEFVVPAETRDISRSGLSFVMASGWEIGTEIECVIYLPVEPFPQKPVEIQCRGRIVRVVPQKRGGFEVGARIEQFAYLHPAENPAENLGQLAASRI